MESSLHNEFRATLKQYAKGYLEGVRQVYRNKEETLSILRKYTRISDPPVLSASYDESIDAIEKQGTLIEAGVQVLISEQAKTDPKARTAKPADFLDGSIISELNKEGFIKQLWAK